MARPTLLDVAELELGTKINLDIQARACQFCLGDIPHPRKGQRFCSVSCRSAQWRVIHEPRCYNCGVPLHITTGPTKPIRHHVRGVNVPRSNGGDVGQGG